MQGEGQPSSHNSRNGTTSFIVDLERITRLKAQGALTDTEFDAAKQRILGNGHPAAQLESNEGNHVIQESPKTSQGVELDAGNKYIYQCKYCPQTIEYDSYKGMELQDSNLCYIGPCGMIFFLFPQILSCGMIKPFGCYWRCFKCRKCGRMNENADSGDCSHYCHHCHVGRHPVNCSCVPGHSYLWQLKKE